MLEKVRHIRRFAAAEHAPSAALRSALCLLLVCALTGPCAVGVRQAFADGDGSDAGSLVDAGSAQDTSSTNGNGSSARASLLPDPLDTEDGQSSQEAGPEPLDEEGNVINDGQVSDNSFLYDAAIADLAGADAYYDGQTVRVTGEVVGDAIHATGGVGKTVWITLVDVESGSSVDVCMSEADAQKIDVFGAYGKTGTTLRVKGTYHLACTTHDGESDIHATVVTVVSPGYEHKDKVIVEDFVLGGMLVFFGLVLMFIFWRMRERER